MSGDVPVTVFRSRRRRACEERQLVLLAVGVVAELVADEGEFLLQVDAQDAAYAARHLAQYESENRPRHRRRRACTLTPGSGVSSMS
jgi:hypothetical protein